MSEASASPSPASALAPGDRDGGRDRTSDHAWSSGWPGASNQHRSPHLYGPGSRPLRCWRCKRSKRAGSFCRRGDELAACSATSPGPTYPRECVAPSFGCAARASGDHRRPGPDAARRPDVGRGRHDGGWLGVPSRSPSWRPRGRSGNPGAPAGAHARNLAQWGEHGGRGPPREHTDRDRGDHSLALRPVDQRHGRAQGPRRGSQPRTCAPGGAAAGAVGAAGRQLERADPLRTPVLPGGCHQQRGQPRRPVRGQPAHRGSDRGAVLGPERALGHTPGRWAGPHLVH